MAESFETEDNPFLDADLFPVADVEPEPEESQGPSEQELATLRRDAQTVQRFANDPQFARQVLFERAKQLGLQVQDSQQTQQPQGPPAEYIETVKASLSPELQFLAPQLATATWTATRAAVEPLHRQQQAQDAQTKQATYDTMAKDLSTEAPGWEQYEDTMLEILGFLRGAVQGTGPMTSPKHGSALKLLYRLASGDAQASAQAGRRMQQAMRNGTRTSAGAGSRQTGPDLDTMIGKAKTSQQKWGLAFNAALREHGVSG